MPARDELLTLIARARKFLPVKTIQDIVRGYVDDITRDYQDVLSGDLLSSEARRRHRTYIRDSAEAVYLEGLKEGGAEGAELTDEDNAAIRAWVENQLGYVGGLWSDVDRLAQDYENGMIRRDQYEDGRRVLYERIGTWGDSLRDLGNQGKASAMANMMVTWNFGGTEVHCRTCAKLDGKRHRMSWFTSRGYIPQEKGSPVLECGGWRCECTLNDDRSRQVLP